MSTHAHGAAAILWPRRRQGILWTWQLCTGCWPGTTTVGFCKRITRLGQSPLQFRFSIADQPPAKSYIFACGAETRRRSNIHLLQSRFSIADQPPGKTCPPQVVVSEAEKTILARKKITAEKALKKKDLDKMNDGELLLLPLKDFRDHGKKEWKKNVAGNFGKQNSEQMKRLIGTNKFNK